MEQSVLFPVWGYKCLRSMRFTGKGIIVLRRVIFCRESLFLVTGGIYSGVKVMAKNKFGYSFHSLNSFLEVLTKITGDSNTWCSTSMMIYLRTVNLFPLDVKTLNVLPIHRSATIFDYLITMEPVRRWHTLGTK